MPDVSVEDFLIPPHIDMNEFAYVRASSPYLFLEGKNKFTFSSREPGQGDRAMWFRLHQKMSVNRLRLTATSPTSYQ